MEHQRGILLGLALFVAGVVVGIVQVVSWGGTDFGAQNAAEVIRVAIPSSLGIMLGFQTLLMSFFSGVLATPRRTAPGHATIED